MNDVASAVVCFIMSVVCVVAIWFARPHIASRMGPGHIASVWKSASFMTWHLLVAAAAVVSAAFCRNIIFSVSGADLAKPWHDGGNGDHFTAALSIAVFLFTTAGRHFSREVGFGKFMDAMFACALAFSKIGVYMVGMPHGVGAAFFANAVGMGWMTGSSDE